MGLRDVLFGKRKGGWSKTEASTKDVGAAAGGLWSRLRGGDPEVRTCPQCGREVARGSENCPVGHYVGTN